MLTGRFGSYNTYAPLATEDDDEKQSSPVEEITEAFQRISLAPSDPELYPRGQVIRPPIADDDLCINSEFLQTLEGSRVQQTVLKMIRGQRLFAKNLVQFYRKINKWFRLGTCTGQAFAFMLGHRPDATHESAWSTTDRINSIFFQLQHDISFNHTSHLESCFQKLLLHGWQLQNQISRLENESVDKTASIAKSIAKMKQLSLQPRKTGKIAHAIKVQKEYLVRLRSELHRTTSKIRQLSIAYCSARKKISKVYHKLVTLKDFETALDAFAGEKIASKNLCFLAQKCLSKIYAPYRRPDQVLGWFNQRLEQLLMRQFSDTSISDIMVNFDYEGEELGHRILVQPHRVCPRIYDSQKGEITYNTIDELFRDLVEYVQIMNVDAICLFIYGKQE